jgi:hypothetical protein
VSSAPAPKVWYELRRNVGRRELPPVVFTSERPLLRTLLRLQDARIANARLLLGTAVVVHEEGHRLDILNGVQLSYAIERARGRARRKAEWQRAALARPPDGMAQMRVAIAMLVESLVELAADELWSDEHVEDAVRAATKAMPELVEHLREYRHSVGENRKAARRAYHERLRRTL